MLFYVERFPERLHHPKEEAFLFRLLRERTGAHDQVLADLEHQHHEGAALFSELRNALQAFEAGEQGADQRFEVKVEQFAQAQWRHLGAEEKLILPAATAHLNEADWREIARAFRDNGDPRFGLRCDEDFDELLVRILNLAI